jgi:very-short-patch-repair endonuclease
MTDDSQEPQDPLDILTEWLGGRRGVARADSVRDAGFSPSLVKRGLEAGTLQRVRTWIATAECDKRLVEAASVSGRVSCVTAAAMSGLWTPDTDVTHLAVDRGRSRFDAGKAVVHWAKGPVPAPKDTVMDPLLNVLFQVARCLPAADALAVWESAKRNKMVAADVLQRVKWHSTAARRIAAIAQDLSDSGMETRFVRLMTSAGISVRQQVWVDGHPLDGLIGDRLAIQLDGFAFHQAADRRRDLRADARLALRGYTTLRFDYQQVFFDEAYVIGTVQHAIAQGLDKAA